MPCKSYRLRHARKRSAPLKRVWEFLAIMVFTVLFTVALIYLTLEVPRIIHRLLLKVFPDYWWPPPIEEFEVLRLFGYVSFAAILILMVAGFLVKRRWLTTMSSIAFYLPTFGYFAFTMFFLAGIGVLRVLWLPLLDFSPDVLRLGDIIYLLYSILALPLALAALTTGVPAIDFNIPLSLVIMAFGLAIFLLAVFTWLYGKFKGSLIVDFWAYKYSRHPQYLGFLLWSYGLVMLTSFLGAPKGGYVPPPSLPWLISALTIVGAAFHEENLMAKKHGEKYIEYREKTPFMLPLPKKLSAIIVAPARIIIKKNWPDNGKEIAFTMLVYGSILVLLSLLFRLIWT
jgi:protein-S-isoprenylcysteine O-methyltransferase Ste14